MKKRQQRDKNPVLAQETIAVKTKLTIKARRKKKKMKQISDMTHSLNTRESGTSLKMSTASLRRGLRQHKLMSFRFTRI